LHSSRFVHLLGIGINSEYSLHIPHDYVNDFTLGSPPGEKRLVDTKHKSYKSTKRKREERCRKEGDEVREMRGEKHLSLRRLRRLCRKIEDPRRSWGNKRHELTDVLIIALLAMICGCETWEEIRDYGVTKEDSLPWVSLLLDSIHD